MEKVKVALAEDDLVVSTNLKITLEKSGYEVVGAVDSGEELLTLIPSAQPDVILLDIDLAGALDGVQTAQFVAKKYPQLPFIYLTSHKDGETFERAKATNPHAYLSKPFDEYTLNAAIELAVHRASQAEEEQPEKEAASNENGAYLLNDSIFVKTKNRLEKLVLKDILYVEASDIYALLHTLKTKYIVNHSLKSIEEKFPKDSFIRIHRSYIVNLHEVDALEDNYVIVNKQYLSVGKTYREQLMKRLEIM